MRSYLPSSLYIQICKTLKAIDFPRYLQKNRYSYKQKKYININNIFIFLKKITVSILFFTANIPILPSKLLISKKEIPMDKIKLQYHTMEKSSMDSGANLPTAFHALLLFVQLLYFQHIKNPL